MDEVRIPFLYHKSATYHFAREQLKTPKTAQNGDTMLAISALALAEVGSCHLMAWFGGRRLSLCVGYHWRPRHLVQASKRVQSSHAEPANETLSSTSHAQIVSLDAEPLGGT